MARTSFQTVDEYIAAQPEAARPTLELVRRTIRKALAGAGEVISYQMPAYRFKGSVVLYFAGWKRHYSLYPAGERLVAAFADELAGYEISKGTIRFPLSEPVPVRLIGRLAKFRVQEEAGGREKSKAAAAKKKRPAQAARKG